MGVGGVSGSQVSATYADGDKSLKVELVDLAAAGALAGLGSALNVQSEQETADGFERTRSENGQMVTEKWNGAAGRGEYSTTFGGRFMPDCQGRCRQLRGDQGICGKY